MDAMKKKIADAEAECALHNEHQRRREAALDIDNMSARELVAMLKEMQYKRRVADGSAADSRDHFAVTVIAALSQLVDDLEYLESVSRY